MCIQGYLGYTSLTLLGSDNDDTIGCARTIDCGRRGILQYLDIINIIGCQKVDIGHWHTIYYIERIVAAIQ